MQSTFNVIIDTEQGGEVYPAANLTEAIDIYLQKLDEYPQSQIHLVHDIPSAPKAATSASSANWNLRKSATST